VDGQENPLPTILSSRFYEVQPYLTLSRHVYSAFVLLLSKARWDRLDAQDRALILRAAQEARDYQRQLNREATTQALEQLRRLGMQVTRIEVRDAESVRRRLRPVLDKYNQQIGERTVIQMYLALSQLRAGAQR
jgi:TRAP-type C4-dicarboxylate transport system substrate-binding protein